MDQIRVQILLPIYYNDDETGVRRQIEDEKFDQTYSQCMTEFGGWSLDQYLVEGAWIDPETGKSYGDTTRPIWIICDASEDNITKLQSFKDDLMHRFEQLDIMMYYSIIHRF